MKSGAGQGKLSWLAEPVTVRVPATSANLGPGFDALGLALTLHDVVEARILPAVPGSPGPASPGPASPGPASPGPASPGPAGVAIEVSGTGQDAASAGEDHLVIRAMRAYFAVLGEQPPGIGIRCRNAIPQGYGLGSSAGAIAAGLLAARALAAVAGAAGLPDEAVLRMAAELEGHPDNVAACLAGGLTIAWQSASGVRFARLSPLAGLAPVLCVPAEPLATAAARQVLPPAVPHADAAANSARAALLIAALTGDPELLMDATQDFLHQRYRAAAMPQTARLIAQLRAAGVPAVVSGAGPSVLALTVPGLHPAPAVVASVAHAAGPGWRILPLAVDYQGAAVGNVPD